MEDQTIISCQFSYYPLATTGVNEEVKEVLKIIVASDLQYETGAMSTIVFGESSKIFSLLEEIASKMNRQGFKYALSISISNLCNCHLI
ncbi:MAG: hypothetical protein AVO34_00255 [Firmicutes bacterium ML8_F2]|jgi:uncharacterized protein YqgV (UPF0045/DUF77 family)|nr:MAG: hypothetical protein AVO34_00255 [Firmicutes bacterium ML8_F2]